jgi:type II secretory pathway component GspD/PulD (secretin)
MLPEQRKDGSADLVVRTNGKPQQQVVAQGTKLSAGGHEITVEEIGCDVTKPERRWVRVRMTFRTQPVEEALPGARRIPGLTIEPVNDLNALIVHYEKQDDLKAVQAMVKDLDVPIRQISVETMFIQPAAGAKRPFDPVADLGATMREFKSSEILRSQDEKAQPAMKPTRLPVIMDLTYEKQEKLRSIGVNGPKVTSLNKREAVFRIDALAPKETPRQVTHDKTTILRVTPEIGKDGKTIRLKNVWLEILDLTKDARGRERVEPTARQFDIEVRNGESVLLTGPEFKGQYVLLTPYLVE